MQIDGVPAEQFLRDHRSAGMDAGTATYDSRVDRRHPGSSVGSAAVASVSAHVSAGSIFRGTQLWMTGAARDAQSGVPELTAPYRVLDGRDC
jgi:hypothetical protein